MSGKQPREAPLMPPSCLPGREPETLREEGSCPIWSLRRIISCAQSPSQQEEERHSISRPIAVCIVLLRGETSTTSISSCEVICLPAVT